MTDEAGPRWLSADEQRAWRGLVLLTQHLDGALDRQLQRDAGLNHAHYGILVALSEAPEGRLRMGDLAGRLRYSPSRLTHAVAGLQRKGWVRREPCPGDRRGLVAELTDIGRRELEAAAPGHVAEVRRRVFDRLSAEQVAALTAICETLLSDVDDAVRQ